MGTKELSIHGGRLVTSDEPDSRHHLAIHGNETERFYTVGAALWWLELKQTLVTEQVRSGRRAA